MVYKGYNPYYLVIFSGYGNGAESEFDMRIPLPVLYCGLRRPDLSNRTPFSFHSLLEYCCTERCTRRVKPPLRPHPAMPPIAYLSTALMVYALFMIVCIYFFLCTIIMEISPCSPLSLVSGLGDVCNDSIDAPPSHPLLSSCSRLRLRLFSPLYTFHWFVNIGGTVLRFSTP